MPLGRNCDSHTFIVRKLLAARVRNASCPGVKPQDDSAYRYVTVPSPASLSLSVPFPPSDLIENTQFPLYTPNLRQYVRKLGQLQACAGSVSGLY